MSEAHWFDMFCCMVVVGMQVPASRRVSCLPEGYQPVIEKLKGQAESYGGFLKLMRRSSRVGEQGSAGGKPAQQQQQQSAPVGVPSGAGGTEREGLAPGGMATAMAVVEEAGEQAVVVRRKGGLKRGPRVVGGVKRRICFVEAVKVVHIPSHEEYSRRIRDQYWSSAEDIYESACRNLIEFEFEGNAYEQAVEEQDMILCESGELVHPAHFDFAAMTTAAP